MIKTDFKQLIRNIEENPAAIAAAAANGIANVSCFVHWNCICNTGVTKSMKTICATKSMQMQYNCVKIFQMNVPESPRDKII